MFMIHDHDHHRLTKTNNHRHRMYTNAKRWTPEHRQHYEIVPKISRFHFIGVLITIIKRNILLWLRLAMKCILPSRNHNSEKPLHKTRNYMAFWNKVNNKTICNSAVYSRYRQTVHKSFDRRNRERERKHFNFFVVKKKQDGQTWPL